MDPNNYLQKLYPWSFILFMWWYIFNNQVPMPHHRTSVVREPYMGHPCRDNYIFPHRGGSKWASKEAWQQGLHCTNHYVYKGGRLQGYVIIRWGWQHGGITFTHILGHSCCPDYIWWLGRPRWDGPTPDTIHIRIPRGRQGGGQVEYLAQDHIVGGGARLSAYPLCGGPRWGNVALHCARPQDMIHTGKIDQV